MILSGFDPPRDTPVEILHTFLLGVVKYFWSLTILEVQQAKQMDLFRTRLTSVNETGLNIPKLPHDYVLRYHGALIGKHFKGLVQIMAFIVNGLVREKLNLGWNLLGRLAVLIWESDIVDLDCHCVSNSKTRTVHG